MRTSSGGVFSSHPNGMNLLFILTQLYKCLFIPFPKLLFRSAIFLWKKANKKGKRPRDFGVNGGEIQTLWNGPIHSANWIGRRTPPSYSQQACSASQWVSPPEGRSGLVPDAPVQRNPPRDVFLKIEIIYSGSDPRSHGGLDLGSKLRHQQFHRGIQFHPADLHFLVDIPQPAVDIFQRRQGEITRL